MNCQILFSGKNKKRITNLSFAELAKRMKKKKKKKNGYRNLKVPIKNYLKKLFRNCKSPHFAKLLLFEILGHFQKLFWAKIQCIRCSKF